MPVLFETRGHAAILTLSRPEARNAWGDDYNEGLKSLLKQAEDDHGIRCVILTGDERGRAFSAGANIANPVTHMSASAADFITGEIPAEAELRRQPADGFSEAGDRRRQRLCRRHRLHRDLLLRPDRRLGARRMAAAAGQARHPAGLWRRAAAGALGRQGQRDARRARLSDRQPRRRIASASRNGWCRTSS